MSGFWLLYAMSFVRIVVVPYWTTVQAADPIVLIGFHYNHPQFCYASIGNRAIGRPLNWLVLQLADPMEYDWMSLKLFSIFSATLTRIDSKAKCASKFCL